MNAGKLILKTSQLSTSEWQHSPGRDITMQSPVTDRNSPPENINIAGKEASARSAMEEIAEKTPYPLATNAETPIPETKLSGDADQNSPNDPVDPDASESKSSSSTVRRDIFKALEVVERDSVAIAESFASLFSSLRLALSEVTSTSVEHMQCFNDAAGHLQVSALDAASKGNRYINSCLRLNQEMKGIESLAIQLKILRRNVDALDSAVNRILRPP